MVVICGDCKRWKGETGGNQRRCPVNGRLRWKGENAEECPHLIFLIHGEEIAC